MLWRVREMAHQLAYSQVVRVYYSLKVKNFLDLALSHAI